MNDSNTIKYLNKKGIIGSELVDVDKSWQYKTLVKHGSCLIVLMGLIGVAIYAFSHGNSSRLLYPTNSKGELCGQHNQSGRPYLLYFDLTQCEGISPEEVCPTTRACVAKCPNTYWTYSQGKPLGLEKFCKNVSYLNTTTMEQIVQDRLCPPYPLPSKPVLGRCAPVVGLVKREERDRAKVKISGMKNAEEDILNIDSFMNGIGYVMNSIDERRHMEKFLTPILESWWIILMDILLALMISFAWIFIFNFVPKAILWMSTVLCILLLVAGTVQSFMTYSKTKDKSFPNTINRLTSFENNKIVGFVFGIILCTFTLTMFFFSIYCISSIKTVINCISEASNSSTNFSRKKDMLYSTIQSVLLILLLSISLTVSMFLATTGSPELRVVDSCSSETCHNNHTGRMFSNQDICDEKTFSDCTGCPRAQCVFHKYGSDRLATWLQFFHLASIVVTVAFVKSFTRFGNSGEVDDRGLMSHLRSLFKKNEWGTNILIAGYQYIQKTFINPDKTAVLRRLETIVIFSVKLFISKLVATLGFTIFSSQFHLNYQFGFILINIVGVYISIFPLLNISMKQDTLEDFKNKIELENVNALDISKISFSVNRRTIIGF